MSRLITIPLALFLAGLGVIIGSRMSVDAMGMVVGVIVFAVAQIPMTLLVAYFLSERRPAQPQEQPPIIVIDGKIRGGDIIPYPTEYYAGGRWRQIEPPKERQ